MFHKFNTRVGKKLQDINVQCPISKENKTFIFGFMLDSYQL